MKEQRSTFFAIVAAAVAVQMLAVVFVIAPTPTPVAAQAGNWSINAQIGCIPGIPTSGHGYPQGETWLNWWSMSPTAWGRTEGTLWRLSGSSWLVHRQGGKEWTGSVGNANVNLSSPTYPSTYYQITGAHVSNFFSGTHHSASPERWCW